MIQYSSDKFVITKHSKYEASYNDLAYTGKIVPDVKETPKEGFAIHDATTQDMIILKFVGYINDVWKYRSVSDDTVEAYITCQ